MATIKYYRLVAVKFSGNEKHHHFISNVFMLASTDEGTTVPGRPYTKDQAIEIQKTTPIYTYEWDYINAGWKRGAEVDTEEVKGITYLRTAKNGTILDNLKNLIDYDYFGRV
jgi:hypothetical protein